MFRNKKYLFLWYSRRFSSYYILKIYRACAAVVENSNTDMRREQFLQMSISILIVLVSDIGQLKNARRRICVGTRLSNIPWLKSFHPFSAIPPLLHDIYVCIYIYTYRVRQELNPKLLNQSINQVRLKKVARNACILIISCSRLKSNLGSLSNDSFFDSTCSYNEGVLLLEWIAPEHAYVIITCFSRVNSKQRTQDEPWRKEKALSIENVLSVSSS